MCWVLMSRAAPRRGQCRLSPTYTASIACVAPHQTGCQAAAVPGIGGHWPGAALPGARASWHLHAGGVADGCWVDQQSHLRLVLVLSRGAAVAPLCYGQPHGARAPMQLPVCAAA